MGDDHPGLLAKNPFGLSGAISFDYGQSPDQIAGGLGTNDHRWNYWKAQQRVNQTILGGDCG